MISLNKLNKNLFLNRFSFIKHLSSSSKVLNKANNNFSEVQSKPKPKAVLRRTAAQQSAPVRSKVIKPPGSTDVNPVVAFSTAERYDFESLLATLKQFDTNLVPDIDGAIHVPIDLNKEVFIFRSGSFVTWGMTQDEGEMFLRQIIRRGGRGQIKGQGSNTLELFKVPGTRGRLRWAARSMDESLISGWVEKNRYLEFETEQLDYVIDPSEDTRLQGDLIVLGKHAPMNSLLTISNNSSPITDKILLTKYAFSHALSRSAKLSALESQLSNFLSKVSSLPGYLALYGRVPPEMNRKAVASRMGELLRFRQGLNLELENEGENFWGIPDALWHEQILEDYFQQVSESLEIKPRVDAVNQKITYAADVQSILREIIAESSSHRMELIIIALITVEVALAIITHGPEVYHMIFSNDDENEEYDVNLNKINDEQNQLPNFQKKV